MIVAVAVFVDVVVVDVVIPLFRDRLCRPKCKRHEESYVACLTQFHPEEAAIAPTRHSEARGTSTVREGNASRCRRRGWIPAVTRSRCVVPALHERVIRRRCLS